MIQFSIEPIYGTLWGWLALAAATVAVIGFVTPPTVDRKRQQTLILIRSLAALVLLFSAMRPALVKRDVRPSPATLVIAADTSASMTLPSGERTSGSQGDRWTLQRDTIGSLVAGIATLDDSLDVQLIRYDATAETIAGAEDAESIAALASKLDELSPSGDATDMGIGLRRAIEAAGGNPLAGVVMVGDGTQNSPSANPSAGDSRSGAARISAEVLDSLGVPLWTVPTGPPGGEDATRDVAVLNLNDSFQLFSGNQFDVGFTIETRAMAGQRVGVQLTWVAEGEARTEAASRQLDIRGSDETVPMNLALTAPDPGIYRLEVSVAAQEGEWVTGNNMQSAFVEVREGGGRILILEGPGRPEKTYLRRSLSRFPDLELDEVSIRRRQTWPVSMPNAFQPGQYDIYVIGDLDAGALGAAQLAELAKRVGEGAGLITLGGFQTYGIGGYADGPLAGVLPIQMDASRRRPLNTGVLSTAEMTARESSQLPGPIRIEVARDHPIVDLGGADARAVWNELPELPGANRFVSVKVAAGTQVLLRTPSNEPLLVVGSYGKGRVASLAVDTTYRWWRAGKKEAHVRFWRQLMLWLMSREETAGDRIAIELDARRFEPKLPPEFRAELRSLDELQRDTKLTAFVVDANDAASSIDVVAVAGGPPTIRGSLPELTPGFYRLRIEADDDSVQTEEVAFQVVATNRELSRPIADPVYLQQLAAITSAHGGAAFQPHQVAELVEQVKRRRNSAETPVIEKQRLGDGPASAWPIAILFVGLMTGEWVLRRRWGMV